MPEPPVQKQEEKQSNEDDDSDEEWIDETEEVPRIHQRQTLTLKATQAYFND